ncbi:Hypothetical protein PHPALM_20597 [Phytophthora palmivora]|uniref:Uncharacterized protein n=1 Tax=Phytophthora palmivora TaxID=4796 RepID=A0A2P4XEH2_9STRA|nr:Hypothetical protein PHPALM_20597 [Phytophthora palmivora]
MPMGKLIASQSLNISDQGLDEAYDKQPLEVTNNLDEKQEELLAARLVRQPVHRYFLSDEGSMLFIGPLMDPRPSAGGHTSMGACERHLIKDVSLFLEKIEITRCVTLTPIEFP